MLNGMRVLVDVATDAMSTRRHLPCQCGTPDP